MATPAEKLAESLEKLKELQIDDTVAVIKSSDLSRTHKERLLANGFIKEVIKGWYITVRPDEAQGDSTSWYTSFWRFCSVYCKERFGDRWILSPEQSISIHTGNMTVPAQLLVRSPKAGNNKIDLLHGMSLFDINAAIPEDKNMTIVDGLRVYTLPAALVSCSPKFFSQRPEDARTALLMIKDASDILIQLLDGGHSTIAGRLAGAFRNIQREQIADEILGSMKSAGYDVRETDPFKDTISVELNRRETSPYVNRIMLLWEKMRETVISRFPKAENSSSDSVAYLQQVEDIYVTDAYHSLSIEGYRITEDLVEKVRTGNWDPESRENDKDHLQAMAAKGYWQAFQKVKESIRKVLQGMNPGKVAEQDYRAWYRELFSPGVTAGLFKASDLAGYRNGQVYIKGSMHVPVNADAIRDVMPVLFELLKQEEEASVRTVLGHFFFVYIHPYMDGNGRMGRFLMNVMLASGGYPWTVIPVRKRIPYMKALEKASVDHDIGMFTDFLAECLNSNTP